MIMEDVSAGKGDGRLRVVNGWNREQMRPFEYIASVELDPAGSLLALDLPTEDSNAPSDADLLRFCAPGFCSCPGPTCLRPFAPPPLDSFEVFYADPVKKWALRTRESMAEDRVLFEYGGVLKEDTGTLVEQDDYIFTFDFLDRHFLIDAHHRGNLARFVNHSCVPNCYTRLALFGDHPVPHLLICASRKILKGEELTLDYGGAWWMEKREEGVECRCGEYACRYGPSGIAAADL